MKKLLLLCALIFFACSGNETILKDTKTLNSLNGNPSPLYVFLGIGALAILSLSGFP